MNMIRALHPSDADALQRIFSASIQAIAVHLYSPAQKRAWIGPQRPDWSRIIATEQSLGWFHEHQLVGFATYQMRGYLNCLYVDPAHQQQGVASALHQAFITAMFAHHVGMVWVNASRRAVPVFHHWGYQIVRRQDIERHGERLTNYRMIKTLNE